MDMATGIVQGENYWEVCEALLTKELIDQFMDLAPYHVGTARIFIKAPNTKQDIEDFVNNHTPPFKWAGHLLIDVVLKWGTQGRLVWETDKGV